MTVVDSALTREVMRDISKRPVDISGLDVHASQGIVYIRGRIEKLRGYHEDLDLHEELGIIVRLLRQKPGIRDVCVEVELGGPSIRERTSPHRKATYY